MIPRTLLLLLCLASASTPASPPTSLSDQRIAVLELQSTPAAALDAPEALTDACRGAVVERTKGTGALVLTRENMLAVLKATGAQCKEGECEVETARNLGVAYFITGSVVRVERTLLLTLKVYETRTGALLGQRQERAGSELALLDKARPATWTLLEDALGLRGHTWVPSTASVPDGTFGDAASDVTADTSASIVASFTSEPAGATVQLDGALLCQSTPCSKRIPPGMHEVVFEKERHQAVTLTVEPRAGEPLHGRLTPLFGVVVVETEPAALQVRVNRAPAGPAPLRREVDAGPVEVVVEDRCFLPVGERLTVQANEQRTVRLVPKPRVATLRVLAHDAAGNDLEGRVVVDGVDIGDVGAALSVPVCSRSATVRTSGGAWSGALSLAEGQLVQLEAVIGAGELGAGQRAGETRAEPRTGLTWVWLPGGRVHVGCEPMDSACTDHELPGSHEDVGSF